MHQRARTDPSGGRGATRVPTGTQGNAELVLIQKEAVRPFHLGGAFTAFACRAAGSGCGWLSRILFFTTK